MTPFFSIIIPVYNVAPYLRACLDSVLEAERFLRKSVDPRARELSVEVVCIDDGSTDESGKILDEYVRMNSFLDMSRLAIKVIHQCNQGLGPARNSGLNVVTGDYVLFVDSDDAVVSWWLSDLAQMVLAHAPDLLRFSYKNVSSQNEFVARKEKYSVTVSCLFGCDNADFVKVAGRIGSMYSWSCCFRRSVIGEVRYEPIQPGEDILFATKLFMRVNRYACTDDILYKYLQRTGSTMHRDVSLDFIERDLYVGRMRHEMMTSWERYPVIRNNHLKEMRDVYSLIATWISRLPDCEAGQARIRFFDEGGCIFTEGFIAKIFRCRLWFLFCLLYRTHWQLRVMLLKWGWIRAVKGIVRGSTAK